jgi:hypothetical protein
LPIFKQSTVFSPVLQHGSWQLLVSDRCLTKSTLPEIQQEDYQALISAMILRPQNKVRKHPVLGCILIRKASEKRKPRKSQPYQHKMGRKKERPEC